MINTINDFIKEHKYCVIVNYDIADKFGYGLTFRSRGAHGKGSLEIFRKDGNHYIKYPQIQPYLELNDYNQYELFIIHDHKLYKINKIDDDYFIEREVLNVSDKLYMDDVFYFQQDLITPRIQNEKIYTIKENVCQK